VGARRLEVEIRKAGPDGITKQQLLQLTRMGKETFRDALDLLADRPEVDRTEEPRLNRAGRTQVQVVFRHINPQPSGFVPADVSRDPAVRDVLSDLGLIEAVAKAKAAGRRNPRAIARWILSSPTDASRLAEWIDLEGALTARIEELERPER
jgi:hypothetical protein